MKNNIRNNLWTIIITSIITILPALAGIFMWNQLPDVMNTHWGADGVADGSSGKAFAVFGLPLILLALHWLCILATSADPNNKEHNRKMFRVVLWIIPLLSIAVNAFVYFAAFGVELNMMVMIQLIIGLLFVVLGNYLPKCKRNSTMGIKLPWTLSNDENWNKTHRLGGKLWMLGGLAILAGILLPGYSFIYLMTAVMVIMLVVPTVYSYSIYRRQLKDGTAQSADIPAEEQKFSRTGKIVSLVVVPIILIGVAVLMFTGSVSVDYSADSFAINATYWDDAEITYDSIATIEYRENGVDGVRVNGFASARLLLGQFENEEFGRYIRYTSTSCESCVVLTSQDGEVLVLGGADDEATKAIYDELIARVEG